MKPQAHGPLTGHRSGALVALVTAVILGTGACSSGGSIDQAGGESATATSAEATLDLSSAMADNQESHFEASDLDYDESDAVEVLLEGTTASSDSGDVTIEGSSVTITAGGTYSLSGSLSDGEIIVDAGDTAEVTLVLEGVDVANSDGAAIAVMGADEAVVILAPGTSNRLTDGATYSFANPDSDEPNATLYSAADLTIGGDGGLTVEAAYNDAIASKDGLVLASGTITVDAADDGIRGKDYLVVDGAAVSVQATGDGLKSDNEEDPERGYVLLSDGVVEITSGDDGLAASTDAIVTGGQLVVDAGSASEDGRGIQGDVLVLISGGELDVTALDDAVHSNDQVAISGGASMLASGDDGVHGDHLVTIDGGTITVTDAFEGIESETIAINDGFIDITSDDDGLNVASSEASATSTAAGPGPGGAAEAVGDYYVYINGGTVVITISGELAEQGDGIDANGHVELTGGLVVISGATDTRNSAIDYSGGSFVVTGGTLIGTNVNGHNSQGVGSGSTQASMYMTSTQTISGGSVVHVESPEGESLVTFEPANDYSAIVFSSPELVDGESYDVYLGGTVTGGSETGLYEDSEYSGGELAATVSASL